MFDSLDFGEGNEGSKELKSTGVSLFFKSVGREVKPAWGNRIVKDFYDLQYQIKDDLFKGKHKFINSEKIKQKKMRSQILKRTAKGAYREKSKVKGTSQKKNLQEIYLKPPRPNPETITIDCDFSLQPKTLGLCPYEYQSTIQGKLQSRSNHHLSFVKDKVNRSINLCPIYYDKNKDINFEMTRKKQYLINQNRKRIDLMKYHDFSSYTERRIFEGANELDKIFDIDGPKRLCSPKRIKETIVPLETIPGRKDEKVKESSLISYQVGQGWRQAYPFSESYSIKLTPRKLQIGRQVISASRGCYR